MGNIDSETYFTEVETKQLMSSRHKSFAVGLFFPDNVTNKRDIVGTRPDFH